MLLIPANISLQVVILTTLHRCRTGSQESLSVEIPFIPFILANSLLFL